MAILVPQSPVSFCGPQDTTAVFFCVCVMTTEKSLWTSGNYKKIFFMDYCGEKPEKGDYHKGGGTTMTASGGHCLPRLCKWKIPRCLRPEAASHPAGCE